ncbi:MAG: hypothetical protein ACPG4T_01590 [Nannocystaceae bacterium]
MRPEKKDFGGWRFLLAIGFVVAGYVAFAWGVSSAESDVDAVLNATPLGKCEELTH